MIDDKFQPVDEFLLQKSLECLSTDDEYSYKKQMENLATNDEFEKSIDILKLALNIEESKIFKYPSCHSPKNIFMLFSGFPKILTLSQILGRRKPHPILMM
jgi:hypothetical protein